MKKIVQFIVLSVAILAGFLFVQEEKAAASETNSVVQDETSEVKNQKVGIMVGDANGAYTWYDLNESKENSSTIIQITKSGTVMVPAWKTASLMSEVSYSYNKATKQVTLKNVKNGRRIVATMNRDTITWYSSKTAKAVTKKMNDRAYISKGGIVMLPAEALKYVMYRSGYQYADATAMTGLGFDSVEYKGSLCI